jgi:EAL domain-containing protein (putative c-di-GMP-specific phosphodiesterase class I)/GGDEF domain-containing protein
MKEHVTELARETAFQLRQVLEERRLSAVFQPIFGFREGAIVGHEALVRGPEGSLLQSPADLFAAAQVDGLSLELNIVCIQEILKAFSNVGLAGTLFLNMSPLLIQNRGFDQFRARRFLEDLGLEPGRVVIELTEDYPTLDFRLVHESLLLYRAMGFRIAIDDLGEGFASLRMWSELRPEFVKADKHFVAGIANDAVKLQFLRSIQHIAESSGSLVIAEGLENVEDFRIARDIGIAYGQGWFIGRPSESPGATMREELHAAYADARVAVLPVPRPRPGTGGKAEEFLHFVDAVAPSVPMGVLLDRFAQAPQIAAIPVVGSAGIAGVVSRSWADRGPLPGEKLRATACGECMDSAPLRAEAELDLPALATLLAESDPGRLADGFVIASHGRYLGMGRAQDVIRALSEAQVVASRYTNPLTELPGQVPINEHLDRLLSRAVSFTAWSVEVDQMRGLNDAGGFRKGDALLGATARLLVEACEPGVDFAGHVAGSRFVLLVQSEDVAARADGLIARFATLLQAHVPEEDLRRGYFVFHGREGGDQVRPLPRLAIGILPVLPGVHESRHEVLSLARHANREAKKSPGSAVHVDHYHGNAYPQSLLLDPH